MKKRSPELIALQETFRSEVVFGGDPEARGTQPCHFGPEGCEGRIEAAHWLKRQRVRNAFYAMHGASVDQGPLDRGYFYATPLDMEILQQAEWDPRNGVAACEKHHRRFDSQRMPALVVWRHEVPPLVEMFAADWGLETALADRCPSISAECLPIDDQGADRG